MFLFHVEDRFGLNPIERDYDKKEPITVPIESMDRFIANEIRAEVNGAISRRIFSCSKSLGIDLFKFNYLADNPLHVIALFNGQNLNTVTYQNYISDKIRTMNYDISSFEYPRTRVPSESNASIILRNYIIDISNSTKLNEYLCQYTKDGKGKKARAPVDKDKEVVMRDITGYDVIDDEDSLAVLYLIYALHYKTGFLIDIKAFSAISCVIRRTKCFPALLHTLYHIKIHIASEKKDIELIFRNICGKGKVSYDAYDMAYDIMTAAPLNTDTLNYIISNCKHYIISRHVETIWNIFFEWKQRNGFYNGY